MKRSLRRKNRPWELADEDPLAGLVNLFDIGMVFSVALLIAVVSAGMAPMLTELESRAEKNAQDALPKESEALRQTIRISTETRVGEGERLGTAYRLKSGEVVYVPATGR